MAHPRVRAFLERLHDPAERLRLARVLAPDIDLASWKRVAPVCSSAEKATAQGRNLGRSRNPSCREGLAADATVATPSDPR